jgi:hypothetical protein
MKWTYRISTIIFLILMLLTAFTDITRMNAVVAQVTHLGYPAYLPVLIGTGKLVGIVLLGIPKYFRLKEWGYAGFTVLFLSAAASHAIAGDPFVNILFPLIAEALLLLSYISMLKTRNT